MASRVLRGIRTVYFDFDGTLHDSIRVYAPAFRKAYTFLVEKGKAEEREWKDEEIGRWLGYSSVEMWKNFMGDLDEETRKEASRIIGKEMRRQIVEGNGKLYDHTLDVLGTLQKRGYVLVFLSNCGTAYMDTAREQYGLDSYFQDLVCAGDHAFLPKEEILAKIMKDYPMDQVIVGDRHHDILSGQVNGIPSIFCRYGYGKEEEGDGAAFGIDSIEELLDILK